MHSTKIRTTFIALAATAGFAGAAIAPAVSQAQWHTLNVGEHIITHGNYTEGSVSPCTRIGGTLGSEENLLGDDKEWKALKGWQANGWQAKKSKTLKPPFSTHARKPSNTAATSLPRKRWWVGESSRSPRPAGGSRRSGVRSVRIAHDLLARSERPC